MSDEFCNCPIQSLGCSKTCNLCTAEDDPDTDTNTTAEDGPATTWTPDNPEDTETTEDDTETASDTTAEEADTTWTPPTTTKWSPPQDPKGRDTTTTPENDSSDGDGFLLREQSNVGLFGGNILFTDLEMPSTSQP